MTATPGNASRDLPNKPPVVDLATRQGGTRGAAVPRNGALAPYQSVFDLESAGNKGRVVLKARFISDEDKRKHAEEFHMIEGSQQLLQRLEEQA